MLFLLQACSGTAVAPVDKRGEVKQASPSVTERKPKTSTTSSKTKPAQKQVSGFHVVKKGETLYSIAWRYNKDFKEVASWNRIKSPYTIFPNQVIRLKPLPNQKVATKKAEPLQTQTIKTPVSQQPSAATQKTTPKKPVTTSEKTKLAKKPALPAGQVKWSWPTLGKIVKSNSPTSKKGIDISGKPGQTIKAAAEGDVVYSGSGLFGYGKLIIIKHNETYLSAYAYNSKLLVKEGDRVKSGQTISYMGQDHSGRTVLHFEIRKNGKPINPTRYLPKKRA